MKFLIGVLALMLAGPVVAEASSHRGEAHAALSRHSHGRSHHHKKKHHRKPRHRKARKHHASREL